MRSLPYIDKKVNHSPHVVILGAGASIASYNHWGKIGNAPPSLEGLLNIGNLKARIINKGFEINDDFNFESFFDSISNNPEHTAFRNEIEQIIYSYFSRLTLPQKITIYDYLILSLREKDLIASFNWDPYLLQAYIRNRVIGPNRLPQICFLHGNVMVGICEKDKVKGIVGQPCSRCGNTLNPTKLLYPVKHKNYNDNYFIKNEWEIFRKYLRVLYRRFFRNQLNITLKSTC